MTSDVTITCPHCRRQYPIKVDPERLQRLKTRATCGRCGNAFDVAARVAAAAAAPSAPSGAAIGRAAERRPSLSPPMSPSMNPSMMPSMMPPVPQTGPSPALASTLPALASSPLPSPSSSPSSPSPPPSLASTPSPLPSLPLRLERIKPPAPPASGAVDADDMAELAREFADAAARFTPVLPRVPVTSREDAVTTTMRVPPVPSPTIETLTPPVSATSVDLVLPPSLPPPPDAEPTSPSPSPSPSPVAAQVASVDSGATVSMPPVPPPSAVEADPLQLLLGDEGDDDFDIAENTLKRAKQPPLPPRSWLELADPGLESLAAPPSATAALLDGILSQPGAPARHAS